MKKTMILFTSFLLLLMLALNCGGGGEKKTETVPQVNFTEGANPSVSAELGGKGFEEIASKLGYQTYTITPEEEIYFGDPKAIKGGSINYIHSLFPRTMRVHG